MRAALVCACVLAVLIPRSGTYGQCNALVGTVGIRTVAPGETLAAIAARAGLPAATLAADNGLSPTARLRPGQRLHVDNRHVVPSVAGSGIVINVPQRMLFLFEAGEAVAAYPVAAGSPGWKTPLGMFEISAMEMDPTWDVPVSIQEEMRRQGKRVLTRVRPGPSNPLGDRWMAVGTTGIGIHGTNAPTSIYSLSTHGCVRLHPDDVRDLFGRVTVGTAVRIMYEPVLTASDEDGRSWVEVHPDAYGLGPTPPAGWPSLGRAVPRESKN